MLVPDFYHITKFESTKQKIEALLILNKDHKIYKGHFPGQPVVPGVMQIQIIKELVEKAKGGGFTMSEITFAKFLNMVVPTLSNEIKIDIDLAEIESGHYKINARLVGDEVIFTKIKAKLTPK